jgi:AbiV family abortive infection protein
MKVITQEKLTAGLKKVFFNAENLFNEALILKHFKALSRAFYLFHMATEECGKYLIIYSYAVFKKDVNSDKLKSDFNHLNLNRNISLILGFSANEIEAIKTGNTEALLNATKEYQDEYHRDNNKLKNASFYVGIEDDELISPNEVVTEDMMNTEKMKAEKCILFIGGSLLLQDVKFEEGEKNRIVTLMSYLSEKFVKEFLSNSTVKIN